MATISVTVVGMRSRHFSLLTLVACVLTGAVCQWLSMRERPNTPGFVPSDRGLLPAEWIDKGFPFTWSRSLRCDGLPVLSVCEREGWEVPEFAYPYFFPWCLAADVAFGLCLALAVGATVEWLVRKRSVTCRTVRGQCSGPSVKGESK